MTKGASSGAGKDSVFRTRSTQVMAAVNERIRAWPSGRLPASLTSAGFVIAVYLLVVAFEASASVQRRAIAVAAVESQWAPIVLRDDGRVVSYRNKANVTEPILIRGLDRIVAVATSMALRSDGRVLTWDHSCGDDQGAICDYSQAREVKELRDIVMISEVDDCRLALSKDGTVWGWGNDSDGQISGLQPTPVRRWDKRRLVTAPTQIPLKVPMAAISAGYLQAGGIDREGRVWVWGGGRLPEMKAPGTDFVGPAGFAARRVEGLPPVVSMDTHSTTYVVTQNGDVWTWGVSRINGETRGSATPTRIAEFAKIVAVSNTPFFLAALTGDGSVLFLGIAPDAPNHQYSAEPRATAQLPRSTAISGGARITTEGELLLFKDTKPGVVQHVEIGN